MENTNYDIDIKDAYYVTRDVITPTKAFILKVAGHSGTGEKTWYLAENGWREGQSYSWYKDIAWTEEEAEGLKRQKIEEHIKYLQGEQERNAEMLKKMQEELNKPTVVQ